MILQTITFYMFAAVVVAAGFMVISSRNPVHSVLFLILAFFTSAGLFVLMGAEFIAMIGDPCGKNGLRASESRWRSYRSQYFLGATNGRCGR